MNRFAVTFAVLALFAVGMYAQDHKAPQGPPTDTKAPEAKPEDVKSTDAIVAALYDVISGPAGAKRDWDRMRSLFAKDAKMGAVVKNRAGELVWFGMTVEDYISRSGPVLETRGFFEREIAKRTEQFGQIAHVWTTYESRSKKEDEKPFERGINSIQLFNDGKRWWIQTVYWQGEAAGTPLPEKYLKSGGE